jgi:hypothetical protein
VVVEEEVEEEEAEVDDVKADAHICLNLYFYKKTPLILFEKVMNLVVNSML